MQCAKAGSTLRSSRAPPHLSTNQALRRVTSEVGRDPVRSRRCGRQRFRVAGAPRERFVAQWGRRRDRKSTAAPGRNPCRNIACCQLRVALGPKQTRRHQSRQCCKSGARPAQALRPRSWHGNGPADAKLLTNVVACCGPACGGHRSQVGARGARNNLVRLIRGSF